MVHDRPIPTGEPEGNHLGYILTSCKLIKTLLAEYVQISCVVGPWGALLDDVSFCTYKNIVESPCTNADGYIKIPPICGSSWGGPTD